MTVRLEGHVERRKKREMRIGFWWVNLKERDRLEEQGLDWRRVKLDLREIGWEDEHHSVLSQERDWWWADKVTEQISGFIKCVEFLGWLGNYYLLKREKLYRDS